MTRWTAAEIPDQHGRRFVVTGANSGIGLVAARELARAGAHVVLACRDLGRGDTALATIRAAVPDAAVELRPLDVSDLQSVRAFAGAFEGPLDVLVNNAGVMATPARTTNDGFELQLGTNHLGHFALTGLLLGRLLATDTPRVVSLASLMHRLGTIAFDDLQHERSYHPWLAYGQSKLANLLFTYELQRRADAAGVALRSVAAHPGYTATNLQVAGASLGGASLWSRLMGLVNPLVGQSVEVGALPSLYAATVPELHGGSYVGPGGLLQMRGHPRLVGSSVASKDVEIARRLWDESERLTGVTFALTPRATVAGS
ncbi:MAG: short-chain dehydrogenase/reductase [Solirubrobacterales bacterium]|nr:short-chain dehydrogenase/reductase [Solirubrobacterales bacterium]